MTNIQVQISYSHLAKRFVEFLCKELSVFPKKLVVAPYEVHDGVLGLCIDESEEEFVILVKEEDRDIAQVFNTIAHEMIHVKQHMKENLGWFLDNRSDIPYLERWWEKEAFSMAVPLVEKFAKTLQK